jgi:hypothetical protein
VNSNGFRWKSAERTTVCAGENHSNRPETVGICWNSVGREQSISSEVRHGLTDYSGSQWRKGRKNPVISSGNQWEELRSQCPPPDPSGSTVLGSGSRHQSMPSSADGPVATSAYITDFDRFWTHLSRGMPGHCRGASATARHIWTDGV